MYWNNLEKISTCIWEAFCQPQIAQHYPWNDLTDEELSQLPSSEKKLKMFEFLIELGRQGNAELSELTQFIEPAIESWKEYFRLTVEASLIDSKNLSEALKVLIMQQNRQEYYKYLSGEFSILSEHEKENFFEEENRGLQVASEVSSFFENVTAVSLFVSYLPVLGPFIPDKKHILREIAEEAFLTWKVSYFYKKRSKPQEFDHAHIDSYQRILDNEKYWE